MQTIVAIYNISKFKYVHTHIYIYLYIYIYIYLYVYMYIYVYISNLYNTECSNLIEVRWAKYI